MIGIQNLEIMYIMYSFNYNFFLIAFLIRVVKKLLTKKIIPLMRTILHLKCMSYFSLNMEKY